MPYDVTSKESILEYARKLEGKTVYQTTHDNSIYDGMPIGEQEKEYSGKGGFGQYLEEEYFHKRNDSASTADFFEAGLELKTTPLKSMRGGTLQAKERIVLGMIDFYAVIHEEFHTSHFLEKNSDILLVFYIHNSLQQYHDLEINLVDIWECVKEDGRQIKQDWELIVNKIKMGKAHEISEGDTLYLGACTKGATREKSQRAQPNSQNLAHARAFCFKIQYANHIYKTLLERKEYRESKYKHILSQEQATLEEIIAEKFEPFLGMSVLAICQLLRIPFNPRAKNFYATITKRILGADADQSIYEFDAAGIQIKTIRLEPNGKCREAMSFKQIRFTEIIDEEWEDSDLYFTLTSKFVLIIFSHSHEDDPYILDRVKLWNMPEKDLETVKNVWLDTQEKIISGDYEHFTKSSDRMISHVRPKGRDSEDLMITPQGTKEKKKCFWLNRDYVMSIIE